MEIAKTLAATVRTLHGSSACRRLRRAGRLPAILYGKNEPPISLELDTRQAEQVFQAIHGSERLISLKVEGTEQEKYQVLVRQVHTSPLGNNLVHVDFYQVDLSIKVKVLVEVRSVGKAAGEVHGGLLQTVMHEVLLECLPGNIPQQIEIDISPLNIGDSIHVSDMQLPEGVEAVNDKEDTVMVLQSPRKMTDLEEEAATEEESPESEDSEAKPEGDK